MELVAEEREIISGELEAERSSRWIGRLLNRDHSVISREIARNGGRSADRPIGRSPPSTGPTHSAHARRPGCWTRTRRCTTR
ncbi:MAG: helix-turn-helix domain-containing protein [Pseudonocardiales bacterium]